MKTQIPYFERSLSTQRHAVVEPLESRIAPATFTWINATGGSWTTPANWSVGGGADADGIPDGDDDVTFNPAAVGALLTISAGGQASHSLSIPGDDLLQITGGSLTLGVASSINGVQLGNAKITANGQLTLTGPGSTMSDGATLTGVFRNEGTLTMAGGFMHLDAGTLDNAGTITHTSGRLDFNSNNSALHNLVGGLYEVEIAGDNPFVGNFSGSEVFDNAGTLRRDGAGIARFDNLTFHNASTGVIEVLNGTLQINAFGSMDGGTFNVSNGATLQLAGISQTWAGTFTGSGAGAVAFSNGTITPGVGGAALNFPASQFQWGAGGYFLNGTVTNKGALTIYGSPTDVVHLDGAVLNNEGTITQTGGRLDFNNNNSAVHNLVGATWEVKIAGDNPFVGNFSGSEVFDNAGTLRRDGTGIARFDNVTFHNAATGVIEVLNGTLQINALGSMDGGIFNVNNGATLNLAGINETWTGAFTGSGTGTVAFSNGTITQGAGGAALNFPGSQFQWGAGGYFLNGTVTNMNAMTIYGSPTDVVHLDGAVLNNAGTITQVGGRLDFNNNNSAVHNLVGATWEVKIAGPNPFVGNFSNTEVFDNAGTLRRDGTGIARFDNVTFHNASTGVIEVLNGTLQINALGSMDGGTFNVLNGATLNLAGINETWTGTFTGGGTGAVVFTSGTITPGAGGATLNFPAGQFQWGAGAYFLNGTVANVNAMTIFGSPTDVVHLDGAVLNNTGTITQTGGRLDFNSNNSAVHNLAGATWEVKIAGDNPFVGNFSGSEVFDNAGTLRRDGTGIARFDNVNFHNAATGVIEVLNGTLQMNAQGSMDGGVFKVANGATLNLAGLNETWSGTYAGSGQGVVAFSNGTITPKDVVLNFPTGMWQWGSGGYFNNGTVTNVNALTIVGSPANVVHLDGAVLNNAGTVTQTGGRLDFNSDNSAVHNLVGATWEVKIAGDNPFVGNFSNSEIFDNAGTLRRDGTGIARFDGVNFSNTGTVDVVAGTLQLNTTVAQISGSTLTAGVWKIAPGATMILSANITTNIASIELGGTASGFDTIATNQGNLSLRGGHDITSAGNFSNTGTLSLGPGSTLTVNGTYTSGANSGIEFQLGGAPGSGNFGKLVTTGAATLAGTAAFSLANGYGPLTGQQFTVATFPSHTGSFAKYDGVYLQQTKVFDPILNAGSLVLTAVADAADLVPAVINAPANGVSGQNVTIDFKVTNTATATTFTSTWTDSVFLSLDNVLDPSDKLVGRVTHNGALAGGGFYNASLTAPLPGVVPGGYHFIVVTDSAGQMPDKNRANNTQAAAGSIATDMTALASGVPVNGSVASGADVWYRVDLPAGATPHFHLATATPGAAELYVRQNDTPTLGTFDLYAYNAASATQDQLLGSVRAGTFYVLVHGRENADGGTGFTLTAEGLPFGITTLDHASGVNGGAVTATIHGSLFTSNTTFSIKLGAGAEVPASAVYYKDASTVYATFNLAGLTPGSYAVLAHDGAAQSTLNSGFAVGTGQGGQFEFNISSPRFIRDPLVGNVVTISYANNGGTDVISPLLLLGADHARFRLPDQTLFSDNAIELLAINPDGPAGILPPGAHGQITVIFEPQVTTAHAITNFFAVEESAIGALIDWSTLKDNLRPATVASDAWDAIYANFTAQVGGSTGSLDAVLAADATRFGLMGATVTPDLSRYIDFELEKAGNFGALQHQYYLGAFGRGQDDPFNEHVLVDAFGNAFVESGTGVRAWDLQPDGSYKAALGNTGTLEHLPSGKFRVTEHNGVITEYRASDGHIDFSKATNGEITTFNYNGQGRVTGYTFSNGDQVTFTYNSAGRIVSSTDAVGRVSTFTYDGANEHLLSIATPAGTTSFTYIGGQGVAREHALATITAPGGLQSLFTYDAHGRQATGASNGGAQKVFYSYDSLGGTTITDALGHTMQLWHAPGGETARTIDPTGHIASAHLSEDGLLTSFTGFGGTGFDVQLNASGLATSLINPMGGHTTIAYAGSHDSITSITTPGGQRSDFTYDAADLLTGVISADGGRVTRTYDTHGNVIAATNESGEMFTFTYDTHDQLTRKTYPDGTHVDLTYDGHRNLISASKRSVNDSDLGTETFTYDSADRMTSATYPGGKSVTFTYDTAGRRTSVTDQDGFKVTYTYDALGHLTRVANDTGGANATLTTYGYDALGRLISETRGSGATTAYTYDALDHVASITDRAADNSVIQSLSYTYTADNQVATATGPGGVTSYSYDLNGQLTKVALPGGRVITYAYDADGNRKTVSDTAGGTTNYAHNVVDEYTTVGSATLTWDKDGRLVSEQAGGAATSYQYDYDGRLVGITSAAGTTRYEYDALGQRTAMIKNGVRTDYLNDPTGMGLAFAEYTTGSLTAHYADGLGLASRVEAGGQAEYYHFDITGNTTALTGNGGTVLNTYSYLPFGEKVAATGATANPFTFNGRDGVRDAGDGLYDMRARTYDPSLGRFMQHDPIGLLGGQTNLYTFVGNSPVSLTDPAGTQFIPSIPSGLFAPTTGGTSLVTNTVSGLSRLGVWTAAQAGAGTAGAGATATVVTAEVGGTAAVTAAVAPTVAAAAPTVVAAAAPTVAAVVPTVVAPVATAAPTAAVVGGTTTGGSLAVGGAGTLGVLGVTAVGAYAGGRLLDRGVEYAFPEQHDTFVKSLQVFPFGKPKPQDVLNHDTADRQNYQKFRDAAHTPNVRKYLDLTNAHEPPTLDEITNAADLAKKEAALAHYDDLLQLHNLFPQTYPDPGPPPIPTTPSEFIRAGDPNNIVGPAGYSADALLDVGTQPVRFDGYVQPTGPYDYTIQFENRPDASAPAQVVKVMQILDDDLDLSTFQLGQLGWGDIKVTVPAGRDSYHTRVDATATLGVFVDVDATLDIPTRTLSVTFTSIDPLTGDFVTDALAGFLPPNTTPPQGDGFIKYTVNPKAGLASGTQIDALATIVFDNEPPLDTPLIHNTVDALAPVSGVTAFPGATSQRNTFVVRWTGSDEASGSGLGTHNIFYTDNDGPRLVFALATTDTAGRFTGEVGHTYKFFSQAVDNVGNVEEVGLAPDATITVVAPTFVTVGKKKVFTDADGDQVTVTYKGPGTAKVALLDPDGDGKGAIDFLQIDGSTAKSKVAVTVKKEAGGDGAVQIGDAIVNGALGSFTAKQSDLVINGLLATGNVKALTVRDVLQPDALLADPLIKTGAAPADKMSLTVRALADGFAIQTLGALTSVKAASIGNGSISAAKLGKLTVTGGDMNAGLDIAGAVGNVTVKGTVGSVNWGGASFGAVSVGGDLHADIDSLGAIKSVTVKNGTLDGQITARNVGAVSVTGGNFAGLIASSTPAATLGRTAAMASLKITGGDLGGDISLLGSLGAIMVKAKQGIGGSISDATITAAKIAGITVAQNLTDSLILAGASLGADLALGGTGTDADTFAAGTIGAVNVDGAVAASTLAAGLDPTDGILHNGNDVVVGGVASRIASVLVKGQADATSYFAAGKFTKKPKIAGQTIDPTADARFLIG